ncbi:Arm DNA-binding domain-containing protein, partial [Enterococcus raffinosus]
MAMIKQYQKKNGDKAWYFKTYLGINPLTGKKQYTTKRGFKTKKEAKIALAKLELQAKDNKYTPQSNMTFGEV